MKRVSQIAFEVNVSVNTLLVELKNKYSKQYNPSSKITYEKEKFIKNKFIKDFQIKKLSKELKIKSYFNVDENFKFSKEELKNPSESIKTHLKINRDLINLQHKKERFYLLEDEEVTALLNMYYSKLEDLQSDIKIDRMNNEFISKKENEKIETENNKYFEDNDFYDPEDEIMSAFRNGEADKFGF